MARFLGKEYRDRFDINRNFSPESTSDFHRDDFDTRDGNPQQLGNLLARGEGSLSACPNRDMAVRVPVCRGIVRLDVPLMHGRRVKLPLNDVLGSGKSLGNVSHFKTEMLGDVAD